MMNNNERINKLEMAIFILECKDHWDGKDWNKYNELTAELNKLKNN